MSNRERSISGPLLYRPEMIDPSLPTGLWWCADAADVKAVEINAVCKSALADWDEVNAFQEWVSQFYYLFVAIPPGKVRDEVVDEVHKRFGIPVLVADPAAFKGNGSIEELRKNLGVKAVENLLIGAAEVEDYDLLKVSEIDVTEPTGARRCMSGIVSLDYCTGGFRGGELSVWTGKRGEGKSTWLGNMLVEAVNQGSRVCAYSGELLARKFKLGLLLQAAGPKRVKQIPDPETGRTEYAVTTADRNAIDHWWDGKLMLTDIRKANAHNEDTILRLFEYAHRKYGCDVFLVDNIMTAELSRERELGLWRAQSAFTQRLSAFAKRHNAHVHLVAHPRKTGDRGLGADDVGGSGDITNLADNVFSVERVPEDKVEAEGCSTRIKIMKNREKGKLGIIALNFNEPSRRYFEVGGNPWKKYGWENGA